MTCFFLDGCLREIEDEKHSHIELKMLIEQWEQKIHDYRKSLGCQEEVEKVPQKTAKRIRVLENRLHNVGCGIRFVI